MSNLEFFKDKKKLSVKKNKRINSNKCVSYSRVSSKEQAEKNLSLENQTIQIEKFAKENQFELVRHFGYTYESAKTNERKEFKKLLDFVLNDENNIRYVILHSVDRFSRAGILNTTYILSQLIKNRIKPVYAAQKNIDIETPSGKMLHDMLLVYSEFDNSLRTEKCNRGMVMRLEKGEWYSGTAIGYNMVNKKLVIDKKIALFIKKAFLLKANKGYSNSEILKELELIGFKISKQRLSYILRNPIYCGVIIHKNLGYEPIKGVHQEIISEKTFIKVQKLLETNRSGYEHTTELEDFTPLKRLLKCSHCGTHLTSYKRLKKERLYYYYKCNKTGCKKNKNANIVHSSFAKLLSSYKLPEKYIDDFKSSLKEVFNEMNEANTEKRRNLSLRKTELKKEYNKIEEKHVFGDLSYELFHKYGTKLNSEIEKLEVEVEKTNIKLSNSSYFIDFSLEILMNTNKVWELSNITTKKQFQNLVFPEGVFYDCKNNTYRTNRINSIFELSSTLSQDLSKNKKRRISKNDNSSHLVAGTELFFLTQFVLILQCAFI